MKLFAADLKGDIILVVDVKRGRYIFTKEGSHPTEVIEYMMEEIDPTYFTDLFNELWKPEAIKGESPMTGIALDKEFFTFADGKSMSAKELDFALFAPHYAAEEAKQALEEIDENLEQLCREEEKKLANHIVKKYGAVNALQSVIK